MNNTIILKALGGALVAYLLSMIGGYIFIKMMVKIKISQPINPDGPATHYKKEGTPTAGGLFFILSAFITLLIFGDLKNYYILIPLIAMGVFALIGFLDDFLKLVKKDAIGLTTLQKLALQILGGAFVFYFYSQWATPNTNFGSWYPLFFLIYFGIIVNGVNISDGLDGLAVGIAMSPLLILIVLTIFISVNNPDSMNLLLVLSSVMGSLLAFLWYNGSKAQVFMGDVGSHALGALIAISALLLKVELIILLASALFFIEVFSSFLQIISIRLFSKKVFHMAPLHHHFEKKGVSESRIVVRFQIASAVSTVAAALIFLRGI